MHRFQCPRCKAALRALPRSAVVCVACEAVYDATDQVLGLLAVEGGQPVDALADPYDQPGVATAGLLARMVRAADGRWPVALGDVLQVGCSADLARDLIARNESRSVAMIDPGADRLRACRARLALDEAPETPVAFAACSPGAALRDGAFDTCIGLSEPDRSDDPRPMMAAAFRVLRPGGRAILLAANRRYRRALAMTLADIAAQQDTTGLAHSADRHALVQQLARMRLAALHPAPPEQPWQFDGETLAAWAEELGFATAEALPLDPDPDGGAFVAALLQQHGIGAEYAAATLALLPAFQHRSLDLLHPGDRSAQYLLWLTKPVGPTLRTFRAPDAVSPPRAAAGQLAATFAGGLPPRAHLELLATQEPLGLRVAIAGWCLANVDISWVRVTIDGVSREAPVWGARPDVHHVVNGAGLYPAWHALCSGVEAGFDYEAFFPPGGDAPIQVTLGLASGALARLPCADRIGFGETLVVVA